MPVQAKCDACQKTFTLKDEFAGKKIRCPACKEVIQVPQAGSGAGAGATATGMAGGVRVSGGRMPASSAASRPTPPSRPSATGAASASGTNGAARPAIKGDTTKRPQRTGAMLASEKSGATANDATVIMRSPGTPCPSCGKTVPPGEQACPHCNYHLTLKRKIGLSGAIRSANMHSQGLNVDGSRKITRADVAEERTQEQKKLGKVMLLCGLGVLLLAGLVAVIFLYNRLSMADIGDMRKFVQPPEMNPADPASLHPLWISINEDETLTVEIPVEKILTFAPEYPAPWPGGSEASAAFAQAVMPPVAPTGNRFSDDSADPFRARADLLGGSYTPQALAAGAPESEVYIWRENPQVNGSGGLRGAILDFGKETFRAQEITAARQRQQEMLAQREKRINQELANAAAFGGKMSRAEAEAKFPLPPSPKVRISGRLSFVVFCDWQMPGGIGSYRFACENDANFARSPENRQKRETSDLPRFNHAYFAPVILVNSLEILPAN